MVDINNKYNKVNRDKAVAYFTADTFNFFENKIFVTFDGQIQANKDSSWMYMSNEWIINLCANIIDCPQYSNQKVTSYLKDFYQFLTGSQYGTSHNYIAESSAGIISDYYEVITQLKTFKAEKVKDVALFDITPIDYASIYNGKISEKEYSVIALCWAYKNTFNTFFQLAALELVTRNLEDITTKKTYSVDSTFIRNGLRFNAFYGEVRSDKAFMNSLFSFEMIQDLNKKSYS